MTSYRQEQEPRKSTPMFDATVKLRWRYIEIFVDECKTPIRREKVLQQLWVDRFSQEEEWRDVPTD